MMAFMITGKELADELGKNASLAANEANFWEKKMVEQPDPMQTPAARFCHYRDKARRLDWMARHVDKDGDHWITEAEAKSLELF